MIEQIERSPEEEFDVKFQLVPGVYLDASCHKENQVILYLGAETYVEYTFSEAKKLLSSN